MTWESIFSINSMMSALDLPDTRNTPAALHADSSADTATGCINSILNECDDSVNIFKLDESPSKTQYMITVVGQHNFIDSRVNSIVEKLKNKNFKILMGKPDSGGNGFSTRSVIAIMEEN